MKRQELENCFLCDKGIMHGNCPPVFYRVKLDHMAVNLRAVQRIGGLEQFFGGGQQGAVLADVMGDNPDIAEEMSSSTKLICHSCFLNRDFRLAQLIGD